MASDTNQFDGDAVQSLLTADDPPPVRIVNPEGTSSFLLIGDHAGNRIPDRLGSLGLNRTELERHIAWDIGVGALGEVLGKRLDAMFIRQTYSRLVIDCNRDPNAEDSIPAISDGTQIVPNKRLTEIERTARIAELHAPYQSAIMNELARRDAAGIDAILVSLHSFTPTMNGLDRPWHIGILHDDGDARFALGCLDHLKKCSDVIVGDNEPYSMDRIDYTVPRHAFATRRPYVEIEVRQDLLLSDAGIQRWAECLADMLEDARAVTMVC